MAADLIPRRGVGLFGNTSLCAQSKQKASGKQSCPSRMRYAYAIAEEVTTDR
jgi:hypothetical protein